MQSSTEEIPSSVARKSKTLGFRGAWRCFIADALAERELIKTLFRRNYVHKFAGSGLGFAWVIIMPCLPIIIYNLLQVMGVFTNPSSELPRSVTLTFGLILYFSFSETLTRVSADTLNNRTYIVQSGIPKTALVISSLIEVVADIAIRTVVYLILMTATYGVPPLSIMVLPLFTVPLIGLGLTIGLIFNIYCVIYTDLVNVIRVMTFYLLFASGVFATIPSEGAFFQVLRSSPIYQLISNGRIMALHGDFSVWPQTLIFAAIFIVILPFSVVAFYRAEKLVNSYL